jgi:hypothetical protein
VKILFSMRHSGALRNFASTIGAVARAGHRVHLVFMMPDKRGDGRLLHELTGEHAGITSAFGPDVKARRFWSGVARGVRTGGDYIRYWSPEYAAAHALRDRAAARVPGALRAVLRPVVLRTRLGRAFAERAFAVGERSMPPDPRVLDLVGSERPDVVLVTPLVDIGSDQVEYLKAARALGIRSGLAVHSWDNLTNKGVLRIRPDRVFVWNEAQKHEAVTMHGVRSDDVVVTGAPVYDQWFSRQPSTTRDEFCRRAGLPPGKPFVLYLCSSAFIAADEAAFVRRWVAALRAASDPRVREAGVLVRPHPDNLGPWQQFDAAQLEGVAVWPRQGGEPIDRDSKNDYFDSIYHAAAAVGINTSAQIEAGIIGRPVYTIRAPEYAATQDGTLHFRYLVGDRDGLLRAAATFEEHVQDLAGALAGRSDTAGRVTAFVQPFVRPRGLDVPATPLLAAAIEELGRLPRPLPARASAGSAAVRLALYPLAAATNVNRAFRRGRTRKASAPTAPHAPRAGIAARAWWVRKRTLL